jgi:hypothetical protein
LSTARAAAKSSLSCGSFSSCCLLAAWLISSEALRPKAFMLSRSSDWLEAFFSFSRSSSTWEKRSTIISPCYSPYFLSLNPSVPSDVTPAHHESLSDILSISIMPQLWTTLHY